MIISSQTFYLRPAQKEESYLEEEEEEKENMDPEELIKKYFRRYEP